MIESVIMLLLGGVNRLGIDLTCPYQDVAATYGGTVELWVYAAWTRSGDAAAERFTHSVLTGKVFVS